MFATGQQTQSTCPWPFEWSFYRDCSIWSKPTCPPISYIICNCFSRIVVNSYKNNTRLPRGRYRKYDYVCQPRQSGGTEFVVEFGRRIPLAGRSATSRGEKPFAATAHPPCTAGQKSIAANGFVNDRYDFFCC